MCACECMRTYRDNTLYSNKGNIAKEKFKGNFKSLLLCQYAIKMKKVLWNTFQRSNCLGLVTFKDENAICGSSVFNNWRV